VSGPDCWSSVTPPICCQPSTLLSLRMCDAVSREEGEELEAHQLACTFLVAASERALFELLCALGQAQDPAQVRAGLRAADLLREMLVSWRQNLALLRSASSSSDGRDSPTFTARSSALTTR
jgi:hypothetical protein